MSIEAEVTVTIASVEVADDYRVELTTEHGMTDLMWSEAEQLAADLLAAVAAAGRMLSEDFPIVSEQHGLAPAHGFDVAPICRECMEGKHGACNGDALIESHDQTVIVAECGCAGVDHNVIGGAK